MGSERQVALASNMVHNSPLSSDGGGVEDLDAGVDKDGNEDGCGVPGFQNI